MRDDLRLLSKAPSAVSHSPFDVALDRMSLAEYLETRGAGRLLRSAVEQAYRAEYGLDVQEQSCLNFLLAIRGDRRSRLVSSDKRYHLAEGNQAIADRLAQRLASRLEYGRPVTRIARTASGRIELAFEDGTVRAHEAVVVTVPFFALRRLQLARSLNLSQSTIDAVQQTGDGSNTKTMVAFDGQPWRALGCNGCTYTDRVTLRITWQAAPSHATARSAVLAGYSGEQSSPQQFLSELEAIIPGTDAAASRDSNGNLKAIHDNWRGGFSCYRPGQFTSIAGNESRSAGNLFFAGEHTNSFYEWQGSMEGAALSGIAAARQIVGG
jgi:monoamine oxidase